LDGALPRLDAVREDAMTLSRWFLVLPLAAALLGSSGTPATALDLAEEEGPKEEKKEEKQEQLQPEEEGIRDNSFLVEEAYNQDKGVVQHIFNFVPGWDDGRGFRRRTFDFAFTQEWPLGSQADQFSYVIPASRFNEEVRGGPVSQAEGIGDVFLNYRRQVFGGQGKQFSFAPRFSVSLPSGDDWQGLGRGRVGYQTNLPFSKEFERWVFHFNVGATLTPDVIAGVDPNLPFGGRTLHGYNLGGSAIYLFKPNLNFLVESVALWDQELTFAGDTDRTFKWVVNPGVRWAPYTKGDTQWVLGLAMPIGLSRDATDFSLFFYLSFEHPFTIAPAKKKD
jgi:hypothetical protein